MSTGEMLGLLIGIGALAAVIGYLADVYVHPQRFPWLELPQADTQPDMPFAKARRP